MLRQTNDSTFMTNGIISISTIVNFPYLCSNIPSSPVYGVFYLTTESICKGLISFNSRQSTDKEVAVKWVSTVSLTGTELCKFYGRYNNLVCKNNLSLGQMLSDMFIPIVYLFLMHRVWLRIIPFSWSVNRASGGCDWSAEDAYSS
jgi:hypothetical protein